MQYVLIGTDGNEYGPVDFRTLQQWAADDRLKPNSTLREMESGSEIVAGSLPDLFPLPAPASPPSPEAAQTPAQPDWSRPPGGPYRRPTAFLGDSFPWRVVTYSALGLIFFFVVKGFGLVFAGMSVYYAINLKSEGSKWAPLALGVSLVSLGVILIGFYLRAGSG